MIFPTMNSPKMTGLIVSVSIRRLSGLLTFALNTFFELRVYRQSSRPTLGRLGQMPSQPRPASAQDEQAIDAGSSDGVVISCLYDLIGTEYIERTRRACQRMVAVQFVTCSTVSGCRSCGALV